jgi:predicted RNA polymerase sigma factor
MNDEASPVLRVNAAGILAKTRNEDAAVQVADVLTHDPEVRKLYTTAVTARVCALDWEPSGRGPCGRHDLRWAIRS